MTLEQAAPRSRRLARLGWQVAGLLSALVMAACGSGGGDPKDPPIVPDYQVFDGGRACGAGGCGGDSADGSGVGSGGDGGDGAGGGLGEMRNVKVTVTKPDGTVLGTAKLVDNLVSLYPGAYKGAIVLEFADDGSGTGAYFDEGKGVWVLLAGRKLHVMIPSLTHHVSANLLTEAAYQLALHNCDCTHPNEAAMIAANAAVLDAFNKRVPAGYKVTDITNYSVAVSDKTTPGTLPNTHAGRLGTLFAAIPIAALSHNAGLPAPMLAFADQLLGDVLDDGIINNSNVAAAGSEAYGADLSQALANAVLQARAAYGSSAQTLPAALACFNTELFKVGSTWTLTYTDTGIETSNTYDDVATIRLMPADDPDFPNLLEVQEAFSDGGFLRTYYGTDVSAGLETHGVVNTYANGSIFEKKVFSPAFVDAWFTITVGHPQSLTVTGTDTTYDPSGVPSTPTAFEVTVQTNFIGYEDVTVNAGTFRNACHFSSPDGNGGTEDKWITASGQGVTVRLVNYDSKGNITFTSELQRGTVNGAPVR